MNIAVAAIPGRTHPSDVRVTKEEVARGRNGRVIIVDSITSLTPDDAGAIVVSASHGGTSAATFALALPLAAVFFNDAGVGKDNAGIAALDMLQARGIAAGTVSHDSARIGDAQDAWDNGILSHVNAAALALGLRPGERLGLALAAMVARAGLPEAAMPGLRNAGAATLRPDEVPPLPYYDDDLAWVHHTGYGHHVERVHAAIAALLRQSGLAAGARVLDVGCGSGLLARELVAAGFAVHGIDASPAMIELARAHAPGATFEVLPLPARPASRAPAPPGAPRTEDEARLPEADAIVSTGHVLNYLDSREAIALALRQLARALRPGGVLAIDLMTEAYCEARDLAAVHAKVGDDWTIVTRFSRPAPFRFDRDITVFRRVGGVWRRSDEQHRNVTFDAADAARILRDCGVDARVRSSFRDEPLPTGLAVVGGRRSP